MQTHSGDCWEVGPSEEPGVADEACLGKFHVREWVYTLCACVCVCVLQEALQRRCIWERALLSVWIV